MRKEHEHEMREHKEFLSTIAKVKNLTSASAQKQGLNQVGSVVEEIGRELASNVSRVSA